MNRPVTDIDEFMKNLRMCVGCGQTRIWGGACITCGARIWQGAALAIGRRMNKGGGLYGVLDVKRLVTTRNAGKWCLLPYDGHKRGCPNFGQKPGCPPHGVSIDRLVDVTRPMYLVLASFNVAAHVRKMKELHPKWSERQCRDVLYWQGTVRVELKRNVAYAMRYLGCDAFTYCPEGAGVNVFVTARLAGLALEKVRHLNIDHHIALIGHSPARGGK